MNDFHPDFAKVEALARGDAVLRGRLETVIGLAVRMLPRCDAASVALLLEGRSATVAVTDHVSLEADIVQYRSQQGPCLDSVADGGQVVRVDLLTNSSAYQRFAPGALHLGVNSVLSVPLYEDDRIIGSLNLYSGVSGAFDATSEQEAEPFAAAAAEAIIEAPILPVALGLVEDIVLAMEHDSLIGQAVGLIMQQRACTADAALEALAELARNRGMTQRQAAEVVISDPRLAATP